MKFSSSYKRRGFLISSVSVLGLAAWPVWATNVRDFAIITHSSSKFDRLSLADLRSLFLIKKRQLPDGSSASLMVLEDQDPRHRAFATQVLGVFPYVLRESWDGMTFSGSAKPPIQVATTAELVAKVASTRGSLGYVSVRERVSLEGVKNVEIV